MCGRLNVSLDPHDLVDELDVAATNYVYHERYNVPPGSPLPILVRRPEGESLVTRLETARWGLVPSWAKDPKIGFRAFNARSETVADKPMFRAAFKERRCVVPVVGYYEWEVLTDGKQPWFMHMASGEPMYMAGLFEFRKDTSAAAGDGPGGTSGTTGTGSASDDPSIKDGWLVSTTILTTASTGHLQDVHDRMPVMLSADQAGEWMGEKDDHADPPELLAGIIESFDPEAVARYPVGAAVGNVRNDGPGLVARLEV